MDNSAVSCRIGVYRSRAEVELLREFWTSCNPGRDADLDFFLFVVDQIALRPHVVVLFEDDVPRTLLVGRLDEGRIPVKAAYFAVPVPKMRILRFVHGGCLGQVTPGNAKLLIDSVMQSLAEGEAEVAMLEPVDIDSPVSRWAKSRPSWLCSDRLVFPVVHRVRDLSPEKGLFSAQLSGNARYQHRKRAKKLNEDFPGNKVTQFRRVEQVADLMRDSETVAAKSYQRGLGVGFENSAFVRSRLELEASMGWLRAFVLYLDEKPSAFWIGSLRNHVFVSNYLAFDPQHSEHAPGMYLFIKAMDELSSDPDESAAVRLIDFGMGDAVYKERFSNRCFEEAPVYIFGPSAKAIAVNCLRSTVGSVN